MRQAVRVNVKTGEVTATEVPDENPPSPEEVVAQMRARMTMTRPELVKAMGMAGILPTREDRVSFAAGNIPAPLRAMLDELPPEIVEDAEVLLLTASTFPRVSAFWDAAVDAKQTSNIQLDNIYRHIQDLRNQGENE